MASDSSAREGMVRRISAALDHIDKHGSLKGFAASEADRKALIAAATAQELVAWDPERERLQLTPGAHKWLKMFFHGRR
jgi:hypothetical protein